MNRMKQKAQNKLKNLSHMVQLKSGILLVLKKLKIKKQ